MFEPDEFIFTKLAHFFKLRSKRKEAADKDAVNLDEIKPRLTLLARALTGAPIQIFDAEREGGYKDDNFFLPSRYAAFNSFEDNFSFYLFRLLYVTVQKQLGLNWYDGEEHSLEESRHKAESTSSEVCGELFGLYPVTESLFKKLHDLYAEKPDKKGMPDFSFIYGKWMKNSNQNGEEDKLEHGGNSPNKKKDGIEKTVLKARAVEEVISVEVDKKQVEDSVLQHQFEKVETADEFGGNFKDMDGDDELEDHENALEDLNMKYTVRVNDQAHSVYQADFTENTTVSESASQILEGQFLSYDEWDYKKRQYKPDFCKVYPGEIVTTNLEYYRETKLKHGSTLAGLRKMLTSVNNKYQQQRRQSEGEEFDLDAITDLYVDVHTRHTPSDKIYLSKRKKEKDLSILILLDISLSSDSYADGNRVIDVEKQVSILFGEILNEFQIDFSIDAFYSNTRNHTTYVSIKEFDQSWDAAKLRVGAIEPSGYTRIGAALRHSGALLDERESKNKWVVLISDGKPNDYDRYEGKYGVNDVKQALRELNERQINSYALAIEAQAKYYLPQMFGQNHYQILTTPVELLKALVQLYEKIKHRS